MKFVLSVVAGIVMSISSPVSAYDWTVITKVASVEPTYIPSDLLFTTETAVGPCSAGTSIRWNIRGADAASRSANAQAVLATLTTAAASGRTVVLYGNNNCSIDYIHLNAN